MKTYYALPAEAAQALRNATRDKEWSQGAARTTELTGTVKRNHELVGDPALAAAARRAILAAPGLTTDTIPYAMSPVKFARYGPGDGYGKHTDAPFMGAVRTDLSVTMWLCNPSDYTGGRLIIWDRAGDENSFKPIAGTVLVYETGLRHQVEDVTAGERVVAVTWIQSRVRDLKQRHIVSRLRAAAAMAEQRGTEGELPAIIGACHSELLRLWME